MVLLLYIDVPGQFPTETEHFIEEQNQILDNALFSLNNTAITFAKDAISDAHVRQNYQSSIKRMSSEIKGLVNSKQISVKEAAEFSYELRNQIMAEHRKFTSAQGLAIAEKHKLKPKSLNDLLDKYAKEKFKLNFKDLSPKQRNSTYYQIIESASRDHPKFTIANKRLKIIGKVTILVTASIATCEILNAENKSKEAIKQGIGIGGAIAGGWLAGLGVSAICGPGAPVCAIAVVLVGSFSGGLISSTFADSLDDEIEEFTKWNIL